jgi:hypothetical protein
MSRRLLVNLDDAAERFQRALTHCDNLVTVHRGHGGLGPGRRAEEISVNRAIVVIAVASWQAVIQDLTIACVDLSTPDANSSLSRASYSAITGPVRNAVGDFATPNAENSRRLLQSAGFDPWPCWTWRQHEGQGMGVRVWTPTDAATRLREWLNIRHAIAHGHDSLPQVSALKAVRERPGNPPINPTLRLVDAEQCVVFMRRLARLTGSGLAAHLGIASPPWS